MTDPAEIARGLGMCGTCGGSGRLERVVVTMHGHALDRRTCTPCLGTGLAVPAQIGEAEQ